MVERDSSFFEKVPTQPLLQLPAWPHLLRSREEEKHMARVKEACLFVLDVSKSMGQEDENGESFLSHALKSVDMSIQQKMMFSPKDEVGIVLFGTEGEAFCSF